MIKTIFKILLMLSLFATIHVFSQKKSENTIFEYTATTRGFFQKIVIQNQTISVTNDRGVLEMPAATKISLKDWRIITAEFKKIKLESLNELKPPSEKRHTDAAAFATLKITHKKIDYKTKEFDNGNPPDEISKLVKKMTILAQKFKTKQ